MKWAAGAAVALAALYGASKMPLIHEVRGLRNNNPGNIRWDGRTDWEGMTGQDKDGFVIFASPEYGIRAMARILASYARRGVSTVTDIVATWAPPEDNNDTAAYVRSVSIQTGLNAVDRVEPMHYPELIAALIHHENGKQPYSAALIRESIAMA